VLEIFDKMGAEVWKQTSRDTKANRVTAGQVWTANHSPG